MKESFGILAGLWHDPVFSGWAWGSSVGIMAYMHWANKRLLRDRQGQIDRLSVENREYRATFKELTIDQLKRTNASNEEKQQ